VKEQLAERLLARVMNWDPEHVAAERPVLQAMAAYKYDKYQRYSPGLRFLESLALWLSDLATPEHKLTAYRFVRERLIFFSADEIEHLVRIAYPDFIRPRLLRRTAQEAGLNPHHLRAVAATPQFRINERATLYLGLSDGARTDYFRRSNEDAVSHEQILQSYEIKSDRVDKLLAKLRTDLPKLQPGTLDVANVQFRTVVLLDDFSASGTTYLRFKKEGVLTGKVHEFSRDILDPKSATAKLVDPKHTRIILLLYIATDQAVRHLETILRQLWDPHGIQFEVVVVHPLGDEIRVKTGDPFESILDAYYDSAAMEDEHTDQGGKGVKFGYAGCALPVVLVHNTPNNSVFPLWESSPKLRALFPRVSRHKEL